MSEDFCAFALRVSVVLLVSVSAVTYCNINPESYLSNFRGSCYLLCSFFVHLSGRRFLNASTGVPFGISDIRLSMSERYSKKLMRCSLQEHARE